MFKNVTVGPLGVVQSFRAMGKVLSLRPFLCSLSRVHVASMRIVVRKVDFCNSVSDRLGVFLRAFSGCVLFLFSQGFRVVLSILPASLLE